MTEADVDTVAEIRVRGWQAAYAGLMPQAFLDAMSVTEEKARRRDIWQATRGHRINLVAEDEGRVAGWACYGPEREGPAGHGELYALYVRPSLIGTGIGRALCCAALVGAAECGYARMVLWVVKGNTRARRFYERAGFAADGAEEAYDVGGTPVPEVRYVLEPVRAP